ncbi:MAG: dipeptidyl aminopeptidase/acylaminoacyl peptidase [Alteromonadaceae bacterium]|jgi:dipeptidyl aminopeptidase/acylaminoacyl peptidase
MIKRSLIALLVSSSMAACAASSAAKVKAPSFAHINTLPSPTVLMNNDRVITMEKIMSHPDWIGQRPENPYWADDSGHVLYQRKQPGNELRDLYVQGTAGNQPITVALSEQHKVANRHEVYSVDGQYRAWVFEGDLFIKSLADSAITQITRTSASESKPQFLNDGSLAYQVGDNYFSWDLTSRTTTELAALKMADEPKALAVPDSYIAQEQHKLIKFVAWEHKNAKDSQTREKQLKQANQAVFNQNWHLGKDNHLVDSRLSPNGKWLMVVLTDDNSWREDGDIMPNYVTNDGTVAAEEVRRRVADTKPQEERLVLLDLVNHSQHELGFDTLPGYDEDVLAKVKAENYQREGKTYESKPAPRAITLMHQNAIAFNRAGDKLVVMLDSWDNKDRWLAEVDFDSKTLVSKHRLHDDAWVNYNFNDFGWFNQTNELYYQSEESGFSHLYVIDEKGKHRQLTDGKFEVSDPLLSQDDQFIYFKGNKKHPGVYEIYRVATASGQISVLTDLNGMNDYSLSPDEQKLLVVHSEVAMPPEVYIKNIGSNDRAKRLTYTVSEAFLKYNWNTPAIVPVKSSEAVDPIFTKVYYPKNHLEGPARKAVIFIHGAGYTQNAHTGWAYYFHEFMFNSLLTQQGYVVIDMDYRASKGYGRDWRTWIYRNMGTPEVQDLKDGVEWMVNNANVDRNKVGLYGGSYGGFLTLMSLFKAPDVFKAGAAIRLVSDWAHYNHGYTSNILNMPQDDAIAYERSSPIYFAEGLKDQLLINAPMVDNNVFFEDTVRLVQRMIELEKSTFETAIYPVEPHGFRQPSSWLDEYRRIYKLFETHL